VELHFPTLDGEWRLEKEKKEKKEAGEKDGIRVITEGAKKERKTDRTGVSNSVHILNLIS